MKRLPHAWRYITSTLILAAMGIAILVQIVRIQGSPEVAGVIDQGNYVWKDFYPPRGEIYDRNGNLLAGNKTVYEVGLDMTAKPDMPTVMLASKCQASTSTKSITGFPKCPVPNT